MLTTAALIAPIVLLVLTGFVLTKAGPLTGEDWQGVEKLSFNLLIPALIIHAIYQSDISFADIGGYVWALALSFSCFGLLGLLPMLFGNRLTPPQVSSIFQVVTRWNAFIVLPVAEQLFGTSGLALIALAMAVLIPPINVVNIIALSLLHARDLKASAVVTTILKNPLIIGCAVGLALKFSGLVIPGPIEQALSLVSRGALAIGLLCIGASFDWRRLMMPGWAVSYGVAVRVLFAPLIFLASAALFDLSPMELTCGLLAVASPAAANGYIVARRMGGDAELYAYAMSWQLVATVITYPLLIWWVTG